MVLDLGLASENFDEYNKANWFFTDDAFAVKCGASSDKPMTPEEFKEKVIPNVKFSVESDRDMILDFYEKTFEKVIGGAEDLMWNDKGWDFEVQELMPVLLAPKKLRRLNLSFNKLRGVFCMCSTRRAFHHTVTVLSQI